MNAYTEIHRAAERFARAARDVRERQNAIACTLDHVDACMSDDGQTLAIAGELRGEAFGTEVAFRSDHFTAHMRSFIEGMFRTAADHRDAGYHPGAVRLVVNNDARAAA